jgi:hypothetical protein
MPPGLPSPADGPWDDKPDGAPKHGIGVQPSGGYYDFTWNQQVEGTQFRRIANHNPAGWGGLGSTPWFLAGGDRR